MSLLSVRDLAVEFRIDESTTLHAVKGIGFEVAERSTVALVGATLRSLLRTSWIFGLLPMTPSKPVASAAACN